MKPPYDRCHSSCDIFDHGYNSLHFKMHWIKQWNCVAPIFPTSWGFMYKDGSTPQMGWDMDSSWLDLLICGHKSKIDKLISNIFNIGLIWSNNVELNHVQLILWQYCPGFSNANTKTNCYISAYAFHLPCYVWSHHIPISVSAV